MQESEDTIHRRVRRERPGWRCLDLGCGAMGILGPLSRRVGPDGSVVGLDQDGRRRPWYNRHQLRCHAGIGTEAAMTGPGPGRDR